MQNNEERKHQLRLSIDIRSIKDHDFTAQLYFKYASIPDLNVKAFKSAPTLPLTNAKIQTNISNCFKMHMFESQAKAIALVLHNQLKIQLWHNDRHKKDIFLGLAKVDLEQILDLPLRKTNQSYAKVFDAYVPVDEIDEADKPVKKIASLRVIIYFEDLGPTDKLKEKGFDLRNFIDEAQPEYPVEDPKLPSQKKQYEALNNGEDLQLKTQLEELEYKVVWELETWKKAEEAKARITLKQKEIQFWTNLSEQQKKGDLEKEKQFKKMEANLNIIENKVKAKMNELIKRQQKIIVLEQQLQNKITEVSKECLHKDEQIQRIKRKAKEEKTVVIKQKSMVQMQIAKIRAENARLRVEVEEIRKQDEKSPLNLLKNQLNSKILEIKQVSKELQKCNEIKEEYKIYYGKMKDQVILLRERLQEKQQMLLTIKFEKDISLNNLRNMEQQLNYERQQKKQQNQYYERADYGYQEQEEEKEMDQKERLILSRRKLLMGGQYHPDDELIKQYDEAIAKLT